MIEKIVEFCFVHWEKIAFGGLFILFLFFPKTKKIVKELEEMKFKTNADLYGVKNEGQQFPEENMRPIYKVNKITQKLEPTGEYIDMNELIESARDTCLQAVLERFETLRKSVDTVSDDVQVYDGYREKMDDLSIIIERANVYREELGLDDSASLQEIYACVDKKAVELKASIEERKKIIKEQENEKKENEQESK